MVRLKTGETTLQQRITLSTDTDRLHLGMFTHVKNFLPVQLELAWHNMCLICFDCLSKIYMYFLWVTSFVCDANRVTSRSRLAANTCFPLCSAVPTEVNLYMNTSRLCCIIRHSHVVFSVSDKMGIKTTVHAIVAAKQNMSIPDPETHADFLKCKCFICLNVGQWTETVPSWL